LKAIRAEFPDYAAIHSHVLQDVLARLDRTLQAFFRRIQAGEKAGFPRFKGESRWHSFTFKEYGNGARLDNGFLVLSKVGRIAMRWSRPLEGTPKTVTISWEASARGRTRLHQPEMFRLCPCGLESVVRPLAPMSL
jgi:putative transposase